MATAPEPASPNDEEPKREEKNKNNVQWIPCKEKGWRSQKAQKKIEEKETTGITSKEEGY